MRRFPAGGGQLARRTGLLAELDERISLPLGDAALIGNTLDAGAAGNDPQPAGIEVPGIPGQVRLHPLPHRLGHRGRQQRHGFDDHTQLPGTDLTGSQRRRRGG
jgi:hypothetical protein